MVSPVKGIIGTVKEELKGAKKIPYSCWSKVLKIVRLRKKKGCEYYLTTNGIYVVDRQGKVVTVIFLPRKVAERIKLILLLHRHQESGLS